MLKGPGSAGVPAGVKQRRAERSLNGTMSEVKVAMLGRNVRNMEHGIDLKLNAGGDAGAPRSKGAINRAPTSSDGAG